MGLTLFTFQAAVSMLKENLSIWGARQMRLPYLLLTAAMTVLPVYAEQAIQDMLTSDEIRAEMFGIHMQGVAGVSD